MGKSADWLKEQVDKISFDENLFRIYVGDNKYIFGAFLQDTNGQPDYFAISTIYDTIADLNDKIKYSFYMAMKCDLSESLDDYSMFGTPSSNEKIALYFMENMVFRTAILWDMLAQLCNVYWRINKPIDKIYVQSFFHDYAQGKTAKEFAKSVYAYLTECDHVGLDNEPWVGNHTFVKGYRDKMAHRNSPNISTISTYAIELRPPAIFVLKRVTEDYLKATEFIKIMITDISESFADFKFLQNDKE